MNTRYSRDDQEDGCVPKNTSDCIGEVDCNISFFGVESILFVDDEEEGGSECHDDDERHDSEDVEYDLHLGWW